MRARQKVLGLQPLLSKALDSLCLQLSITTCDENSLGLLQILQFRLNDQITREQFSQLYSAWLQAKQLKSLFATRQSQTFDKVELYASDKLPRDMLHIIKVTRSLEWINEEYNVVFLNKYNSPDLLEGMERIFSYLDAEGIIHLRTSQMLFLFMALVLSQKITIMERTQECFKQQFQDFENDINLVQGKLSLRNFKNYLSRKCSVQIVHGLPKIFREIEKKFGFKQSVPNLFHQAFSRWKNHSRFENDKRKLDIYMRIFEQHEIQFFNSNPEDIDLFFQHFYGPSCLRLYSIDIAVITEIYNHVQAVLTKYITGFFSNFQNELGKSRVAANSRIQGKNKNNLNHSTPISRIQQRSLSLSRSSPRITAKLHSSVEKLSRTQIQRTPSRAKIVSTNSKNTQKGSGSKSKSSLHVPREVEQLQKMDFFRNKRIQPFEVVMKRLKQR